MISLNSKMSMLIADESNFDCQYSRVYIGYRVAEMRNPSVGRWSLPGGHTQNAVSYTHLTLPTIYSV